MDLDAYSAAHRDEWDELARLGSRRTLSGPESDALIDRYQSGATELSAIKSTSGSTIQGDRLSLALSRARLKFTGSGRNVLSRIPEFFVIQLPAALYRIRWLTLAVTAATAIVAVLYAAWALTTPGVLQQTFGSDAEQQKYVNEQFVNYYSENTPGTFTAFVWTNNAWISAQCIAFGIIGVYSPYLLFMNGQSIGLAGAVMAAHGKADVFFLNIAPHGQLELYSVFSAGAAGLMIFWAWIAPGHRTRVQALAEDGRALMTVTIGLALSLFVSGVIEGVVTRQPWPWPVKIGIGTLALAAFLTYQWVVGRRAFRSGATGDVDEFEAGARRIVAG